MPRRARPARSRACGRAHLGAMRGNPRGGVRGDVDLHLAARNEDENRWHAVAPNAEVHAVAPRRRPARLAWEQASAPGLATRVAPDVWHGPHYTMPLHTTVPCVVTIHDMTFFDHPEWHERSN